MTAAQHTPGPTTAAQRLANLPLAKPAPVAWATRTVGGNKFHSIHASKGASDKWLEYRRKEQAQGEQYEQIALYDCQQIPQPLNQDLLRALIEMVDDFGPTPSDRFRSLGPARAAIAKATGEQA